MALALDTKNLLNENISGYEEHSEEEINHVARSLWRWFQSYRVSDCATVTYNAAKRARFDEDCGLFDPEQEAALERQAELDEDEDEVEEDVLRHLKPLAATIMKRGLVGSARPGSGRVESRAGTRTLVSSVHSPTFDRPCSCSAQYSILFLQDLQVLRTVLPDIHSDGRYEGVPRIVSEDAEVGLPLRLWKFKFKVSLLIISLCRSLSLSICHSASRPHKRRRTLNPCHHVCPTRDKDHTARVQDRRAPEANRFKGVRYRADHDRWVAEMKPPKSKNKVSFGEFRSEIDAARVVDVAFHHYGRPLNFPDSTPRIMSSRPSSAGLTAEAKLEVVKNDTKWMKSKDSSLPSPNHSTSGTTPGFRSLSAIESSLILDEADDATSQAQPGWPSMVGMAEAQEAWGVANGIGDRLQSSTMQWSMETAMVHDPSDFIDMNPEHFGGALTAGVISQATDFGDWMPVDISDAHSVSPMRSQMGAADGSSWEQEIAFVGRDWASQFQSFAH